MEISADELPLMKNARCKDYSRFGQINFLPMNKDVKSIDVDVFASI